MDLNLITPRDAGRAGERAPDPDGPYARLVKLVPVPVVGAYLGVHNIVGSAPLAQTARWWVLGVVAVLLGAVVVLYFRQRGVLRWTQVAASLAAFAIWVFGVTVQTWVTGVVVVLAGAVLAALRLRPLPPDGEDGPRSGG